MTPTTSAFTTVPGRFDAQSIRKEENTLEFQYDRNGRMKYHPEFHFSHKEPFTEEDMEYLCKFYYFDGVRAMSYALGKSEKAIADKVSKLKKAGMFNYYKKLNKYYV